MKQPRAYRVDHHVVQTAVWTLHHSDKQQTVTLVATHHIADPQYYRQILDLADETEAAGGLVQREGTEPPDETLLAKATDDEKRVLEAMCGAEEHRALLRNHLEQAGLVVELDALVTRPHWRSPDVDRLAQVRLFGVATSELRQYLQPRAGGMLTQIPPIRLRGVIRTNLRLAPVTERLRAKSVFRTVVAPRRDQNAALDLLAIPGPATVMAIWGAGHLPGIRTLLERNGFALVDERWLDAIAKAAPADEAPTATDVVAATSAGRQDAAASE